MSARGLAHNDFSNQKTVTGRPRELEKTARTRGLPKKKEYLFQDILSLKTKIYSLQVFHGLDTQDIY